MRLTPPLPTHRECIASCQLNLDEALRRAHYADDPNEPQVRTKAMCDVEHWREMRVWYEKQVAAGRGDELISLAGFSPPAARAQEPPLPVPHWTETAEEREPGMEG